MSKKSSLTENNKDKENIKILCLSFWVPPIVRPQSILIGKMIPEWIRQGLEPIIVSYNCCGKWDIDVEIHTVPRLKTNRLQKFFANNYRRKRYFEKVYSKCKKIIEDQNIEFVFSFSNPIESNIIGAMLSERLGVKFVSHFSDPWYDNPYADNKNDSILKEETFIIENSERVVFTNAVQRDLVMKKFPEEWHEKAEIIPHCFDPKLYPGKTSGNDAFTFSYIGAFYKIRNPEIILKAISNILDAKANTVPLKVKLVGAVNEYAGYSAATIKKMLNLYKLEDIVELIDSVGYIESLKYMSESDCLISIDANFENSPFLPSKLADYAGSGKSIVAISPSGSPSEFFVNSLGCQSFTYEREADLTDYLIKLINNKQAAKINKKEKQKFSVENTTKKPITNF